MLDGKSFLMLTDYTVREIFDAFAYGAGIIHTFPRPENRNRPNFLDIYDNKPREEVLFALHMSLHQLLNPVGGVAIVIYQDFGRWIEQHKLPRPDGAMA
jgi:hypothetical protein